MPWPPSRLPILPKKHSGCLCQSWRPYLFFLMSKGRLPDGASPIEGVSPTESIDAFFSKSGSPSETLLNRSPQSARSLHTKPWPTRPQRFNKGIRHSKWFESMHDTIAILTPLPFFVLAATVAAMNGKLFDQHEFVILDNCIKAVNKPFQANLILH